MPKKDELSDYIKNIKAKEINNVIKNLKTIELDNFDDGVITEIFGNIPIFDFEYSLDLIGDLGKLGIKNIFDIKKADLTNLSSSKVVINDASHKANISFSNDGIKASAVTTFGGYGAGGCGFDYKYDVPVKKIDLTFDKPYMFIIRNKNTNEVWFTGAVYEPTKYESQY